MNRVYVPATSAEQWKQFLADPDRHWREGYSARTLAYSWQEAAGFPAEVAAVLSQCFPAADLLLAFPEHRVPLPGGARPSQNDLWVLARSAGQLISIAVEGKVSETFDRTVQEWGPDSSPGKQARWSFLLQLLGLSAVPDTTRYQLLHRTASALIEAQRFNAAHAVMLVHSFSPTSEWLSDYAAFAALFGAQGVENRLVSVGPRAGVALHLAWVRGDPRYLTR